MNRKRKLAAMQRIGDGGGIRITSTPPPTVDLDLAFNPAEPRDLKGRWTPGELHALKSWATARGGVRRIQHGAQHADFESAVAKLPATEGPLYRGVKGKGADRHAALNVGDTVSWDTPRSTSTKMSQAFAFGSNIYEIQGATGHLLAGQKMPFAYEKEAILLPGKYRVTGQRMGKVGKWPVSILTLQRVADEVALACDLTTEIVDLANPSLRRTRYVTGQLLDGKDPATLLHHRGISREVAEAVAALAGKGTAVRPNARRRGMPLSLGMRIERDREALYRGAYLLKAAERVQASVDAGKSLREALNAESPYYVAHEKARRGRLDAVTEAHRIAMRLGTVVQTPEGTTRTLLGWYLDPLLKNDPECVAANGHNYYAEEGTVIGYPGAVHLHCGCKSGPPIEGAGMVNDAVRGVVTLGLVSKKPAYPLSRKRKTA